MKIRTQLTVFFLLITIIPVVLIGFWSFFQAKMALQLTQLAKLGVVADLKADKIDAFFQERRGDITTACDFFNIRRNLPIVAKYAQDRNHPECLQAKSELDSQLKTFQHVYGYSDVMLADPEGKIMYASDEKHAIELVSVTLLEQLYITGNHTKGLLKVVRGHVGELFQLGIRMLQFLQSLPQLLLHPLAFGYFPVELIPGGGNRF